MGHFVNFFGTLSSPRAESAKAFTCRRCPHSGVGEDFLAHQLFFFFYEKSRNSETKSQKIDPKVRNGSSFRELQKAIDKIWGGMAKKRIFGPAKKRALFNSYHVLATTGKSCENKKVPFSQINISLLANLFFFLKN